MQKRKDSVISFKQVAIPPERGEIRPMPHRFFFFQKCGNNIIFFDHTIKKKDSLGDKFYKAVESKKVRYEREFEKLA